MKKLVLALAAAALTLVSCETTKQFSYEEIEFDYPSRYSIIRDDVFDDGSKVFLLADESDLDYVVIEIYKDNPGVYDNADQEKLDSFLAYHAFDILESFAIEDDEIVLDQEIESPDDMIALYEEGENPLVGSFVSGTTEGKRFQAEAISTVLGDYRITAYGQAEEEDNLNKLFDEIVFTAHYK